MKTVRVSLQDLKELAARPDFQKSFRKAKIVFPGDGLGCHTQGATIKPDQVTIRDRQSIDATRNPFNGELVPRSIREETAKRIVREYLPETAMTLGFTLESGEMKVYQRLTASKAKATIPLRPNRGADVVKDLLELHDGTGRFGVGITVMLGSRWRGQKYVWKGA